MSEASDHLVKLMQAGRGLKDYTPFVIAQLGFDGWVDSITQHLSQNFNHKFAAEWQTLLDSSLSAGRCYISDDEARKHLRGAINERISWLGKLPLAQDQQVSQLSLLTDTSYLDADLKARCMPLLNGSPTDPKVWDSVVRTAGVVLEDRLRSVRKIKDHSIGRELVCKVFGKAGALTKYFATESDGFRDLFAGVVGAFRNPSAHRLLDPNPEEGGAYIVFVNLLLKHLGKLGESGSTTREASKRHVHQTPPALT